MTSRAQPRAAAATRWMALLAAPVAVAGLAVWWPMLDANAPHWARWISPLISSASAVVWIAVAWRTARQWLRLLMATITVGCLSAFVRDTALLTRSGSSPRGHALRIVQWALDPGIENPALLSEMERELPHAVVLYYPPLWIRERAAQRGGIRELRLRFRHGGKSMLILSRFPIERLPVPEAVADRWLFCRIFDPAGTYHLLAIEQTAPPQKTDMAVLLQFISSNRPLVLAAGGIRDRTDAIWRPLRRDLTPVFERGGFGLPYSSPSWFPMYSRYHLWATDEFAVYNAGYRWSRYAPHLRHFAILRHPAPLNR
ncbi:MAG: hypothetical protein NZ740_05730 [Kiritimatiellae bacterium]|nr:hypothetical protein [Kiritimatiellia bacterium]MDW8458593.1 hypothetical protein [Verrucomicrobiota bacterium]